MKIALTGIKPTGRLTIGHYLGVIKPTLELLKEYHLYFFIADLHALTLPIERSDLINYKNEMVALLLALGLTGDNLTFFIQSEVPTHAEMSYLLSSFTYMGELSRMIQYKQKKEDEESTNVSLFTYPVLQAADILLYDTDIVPIGIDQSQHLELTRDIATRINNRYKENVFKIPNAKIANNTMKILSLQDPNKKMSKTSNESSTLYLLDDLEVARKKIMRAVTDSGNEIKYDTVNKPGISNLLTIYSGLTDKTISEIEQEYIGASYGTFKKNLAEIVVLFLSTIREKYNELIMNKDYIQTVLDSGKKNAINKSEIVLKKFKKVIGIND